MSGLPDAFNRMHMEWIYRSRKKTHTHNRWRWLRPKSARSSLVGVVSRHRSTRVMSIHTVATCGENAMFFLRFATETDKDTIHVCVGAKCGHSDTHSWSIGCFSGYSCVYDIEYVARARSFSHFDVEIKTFIHFCVSLCRRWIRRQRLDGQSACLSTCVTQARTRHAINDDDGRQPKGNMCIFSIFDDLNDSLSLDWVRFMVRNCTVLNGEKKAHTERDRTEHETFIRTECGLRATVMATTTATTKK